MPEQTADFVTRASAEAPRVMECADILRALAKSGVTGINQDGSMWVLGGGWPNGTVPLWDRSERYALPGSAMANTIKEVLNASQSDRDVTTGQ